MFKAIQSGNWFTGLMIFLMPVILIFFLGSQMAYSQVSSKFEAYRQIPQISTLAELEQVPAGQTVLLRGQIAAATPADGPGLVVYQVRPAEGREVRFQEEFPLVFPEFDMALPDGAVAIIPSLTRERVIQQELHTVSGAEYRWTGFKPGDTVMVQGIWQAETAALPALYDVTGITGGDKASLLAGWQQAFQTVRWVRNGLGLLALLSLILLVVQLRRRKTGPPAGKEEEWQPPTTKTVATT